ncbi:MAG: response regulator transcription factor [Planctomycetota bacterium]
MKKKKRRQNSIRIVLADDHLVVRQGMMAILAIESDFEVVAEAGDGTTACRLYEELRPDVVILDLRMPEMDGFEAVQKIIAAHRDARILIMTTYDTDEDIWRCLKAGAKGYLLKDATHPEIVAAVRAVAAGESFASPGIAAKITRRAVAPELTARELEVLMHLATGQTNKEIAQAMNLGEGTIKTHLKAVFFKLNTTTRTETTARARELGLLQS